MSRKRKISFKKALVLFGVGLSTFGGYIGQPLFVIVGILAAAFHEDIDSFFSGKSAKK